MSTAQSDAAPGPEAPPSLEIKPSRAAVVRVSAVVLVAAAIALMVVLLLAGISKGFSFRKATLYTYLPDATGLSTESEVRLSGLPIGTVSKVQLSGSLDQQLAVRVDLRVGEQYLKLIPVDSITSIDTDTLVGPGFVSIAEGKSVATVAANRTLASEPLKKAQDRADQVQAVKERLQEIDQIVKDVSSPTSPIGHFLVGDAEYTNILRQITLFERSIHAFIGPTNTVGQALFSDKMYNDIRRPIMKADETLATIQKGEGAAGRLFASDEQYEKLVRQLRDLNKALSDVAGGRGSLGKFTQNDEAHRRVLAMLHSTNQLLDSLAKGDGKAAQLLRDPRLYESLTGSLRELTLFLKDFRENPKKYNRVKLF